MWSIGQMKERGRLAFKANYWPCVLVAFVMSLLTGVSSGISGFHGKNSADEYAQQATDTFNGLPVQGKEVIVTAVISIVAIVSLISILLSIFVFSPLEVGGSHFFKKNLVDPNTEFSEIGKGFYNYGATVGKMLLMNIYLFLWFLLFIIPGIVKSYSYRMVPYLIKDHPELSASEVITMSRQMMNGNKWRAFLLDLSFIGWILLSVFTLGLLNIFWTFPYMYSTSAALYRELKGI